MQAMALGPFESPEEYSRPFDSKRCGFVLGEGAAILVLEELEHALERKANIVCELVATSSTTDAFHIVKPEEKGYGALRAMKDVIKKANVHPDEIAIVNCHATSTPVGDLSEAAALQSFFYSIDSSGTTSKKPKSAWITANKGAIGHTFGAAGSIETIFGIKSLVEKKVPPNLNLHEPIVPVDSLPPLRFAGHETVDLEEARPYLLKNSFGFGGVNVCLLFKLFSP